MGNRTLKAGLFATLAAGALWVLPMSAWAAPVFPEGISADGESLAGKTWEDALHTAEEKVKEQAGMSVALTIEDKKAETTAGELGIHWSNQDEAEKRVKKLCRWKPDPSIYEQKGSGKDTGGCYGPDSSGSR